MLYNLVRGPQVCQLFSCYVSPSINKVLTYLLTYYKLLLTFLNRNDQPGHLLLKEMLINRLYLFAANTFSGSLSNAVANFVFFTL